MNRPCSSDMLCFPEYIAMYTYESNEQGDLTFQQGDVIVVTKKEGDWWTGVVSGKTGVFPSNYVKPKDSEVTPRKHSSLTRFVKSLCGDS